MSFFKPKTEAVAPRKAPWAEKYRPRSLGDVASQEMVVETLKKTLQSANLPHMLFYGPPGTGKTSTILALAKDLFGPELSKSRVLELNASDERGINVVREKIKNFARTVVTTPPASAAQNYPCPPFKIIILDEADSMTQDAQAALRRTMETYSKVTRFCLVCNYVTRIIDPLASRCSKFRFKPLDETNALERLQYICQQEEIAANDEVLSRLLIVAGGDLRKAITLLQSASGLAMGSPITVGMVDELAGRVPDAVIDSLVNSISKGIYKDIQQTVDDICLEGFPAAGIVTQLHDKILTDPGYNDNAKSVVSAALSEADKRLNDGADEQIEILNVAYHMVNVLKV
ncbi:Replication factor C subunit 2 [Wickerhamiella sorbophila]|uniref:Replication factor C subunit 2 n=1 Tax=Wickerhamiella sorbophila TaxID=45607 RepID=A0A2T0FQ07_9ASCO|nr:Replication factor C subunit 2 [Wickerhamiella sorbophila]PRT57047.1 Replication factor C subunit 2 [Wickerhamiella sorbophila]